jgi:superfamily I DNA/RNA helicase
VAGDDDQAIFRWAGADVDHFIDMSGHQDTLTQSYRVPVEVQKLSHTIIENIEHRRKKAWKPRKEDGSITHIMSLDELDMSEGTWYLLGRNVYLLSLYVEHCIRMGLIFESRFGQAMDTRVLAAVKTWESLRRGQQVTVEDARMVYTFMSSRYAVKYGYKQTLDKRSQDDLISIDELKETYGLMVSDVWHESLDRIGDDNRNYLLEALKRGENPLKPPRIKIDTVHGVKGGEADHVVIRPDMAMRTYTEYLENPDDEARVWYVAVTRARSHLYIMQPESERHYEMLF